MKRILFRLLALSGLPAVLRFRHRSTLTIVLYHGVAPREDIGIYNYRGKFISPDTFARQLDFMRAHYTVLPLELALEKMKDGTLPERSLAITFDDGYRNFYTYAYPALRSRNMPVTMFLATDFVCRNIPLWVDRLEHAIGKTDESRAEKIKQDAETRNRFKTLSPQQREHDLRNVEQIGWTKFEDFGEDRAVYAPLLREEILEMQEAGISFGAHTRSHPILSTQSAAEQREEIEGSKRDLEALGVHVSSVFAYPNGQAGDWSEETETVLTAAGFTYALTTAEGTNSAETHPYRLRRFALDATEDFAVFANVLSGVRLFVKSIL